jgi:hypothetical protein
MNSFHSTWRNYRDSEAMDVPLPLPSILQAAMTRLQEEHNTRAHALSNIPTLPPGQSHLIHAIKDTEEIRRIPSGFEPFGMDADARRLLLS